MQFIYFMSLWIRVAASLSICALPSL